MLYQSKFQVKTELKIGLRGVKGWTGYYRRLKILPGRGESVGGGSESQLLDK